MKTKITQAMMFNFTRRFGRNGFSHWPRFITSGIIMVFLFASGSVFGQSPSISQTVSKATCPSFDDGSIDITVANLSGALTYSWTGPNAFSATSEDISGLIPGNYTVSVYVGTTLGVTKVIPVGLTDVLSPQLKLYDTVEVALDSTGNVNLDASLVIDTAFDDCGLKDTIIGYWRNSIYTKNPKFTCDDIGTYFRVQVQVLDLAGRQRTKDLLVTPKDVTPPVLRFYKNVFLQLGEDGSTILHNDIVDSFSRDVCSGNRLTWTLEERNFDCSDLPFVNAKVRVEDEAGNGVGDIYSYREVGGNKVLVKTTEADSWTTHKIGIDDCRPPVAVCKADTTLYLDSFGNANISALDINNGSTDNCGISYFYMEDSVFNCDKVGVFDYTMTAVDVTGNLGCCLVEITVLDTIKPVIGCKDTTLSLDSNGQRELTLDLVNRGTYDNCSFEQISFNNPILTCGNIGGNSIEMTIVDNAGTLLTCNSNVIIVDDMPPVAICKNFTLEIGAAGTATLQVSDINDGSWDNCAIATTSISKTDFTCADAGTHTITLTVTDVNGNSSTCQSTVDVVDNSAPTISCKNVTIVLDASGDASIVSSQVVNAITDNCSGQITVALSKKDFTCTDIGTNTITVTATDPSGNSASCQATVTVEDNMDPVITGCPSDIIYTSSPNCQEYVNWTVPTISDNCSYTVVASHQPGSLFLAGTTTVTYTVTDAAGNVSTCSFDVKISNGTVGVQTSAKVYNGGWNVSCYAAIDGEITTTVTGGCAGGYTYTWSNGSSSADLTGIGAGTYTVTVSDASGVTATSTMVLTEPSELTGSTNKTDISCGGSTKTVCDITHFNTGKHAVWLPNIPNVNSADFVFANNSGKLEQFSNGTARITGSIVHENDPNYGWEVDLWFNNGMDWNQWSALGRDYKGNHSAAQNNHQDWTYYTFDNSKSNTLTGTGSYLGSTLYLTHRPTNYKYGLQVGVGANDKDGDYGMSTWFNYTGSYSGKGDINVDGSCINTVNCDGSAEILNLAGGTPPYTIQWSNGESTAAIDNLCAGSYTVTVTDQNGCALNETVVISAPQPLVLTVSSNDATCSSGTNGTAGVTVSGGRTPYTYLWSTGSTANSISGLTPGSYSVAVTDASGCLEIAQVEISRPVCCNVTNGGSIAVNQSNCGPFDPATLTSVTPASGGLGTLEYLWLYSYTNVPNTSGNPYWQAIPNSNSATYDPGSTNQTIYYMRCARRAGCSFWAGESNVITIEVYPTITASTTVNSDVSCNGGADGSATAASSVGTTPFTYTWSNGATTATAGSLSAGTYTVTVTDANGCSGTATATVGEPTAIAVNVAGNNATCATGTDGDATATVSGGTSPYTYLWSNGATTSTIQNLSPGTYSVTITDANGCVSTGSNGSGSVTISRPACCNVTDGGVIAANQSNCGSFDPAVLTSVSGASGGLGTLEYLWLYSYTNVPNTSGNPYWQAIPNSNSATYDPGTTNQTIYYMRCARRAGCSFWAGESNVITITIHPNVSASITANNDASCKGGSDGSATVGVSIGSSPFTYVWSNGSSNATASGLAAGNYTVTVTDANGCTGTASVSVNEPSEIQTSYSIQNLTCVSTYTNNNDTTYSSQNCDCNGRMQNFVVVYSGANNASVAVSSGSKQNKATSHGNISGIQNGDTITITGNWKGGRLGPKTYLTIGGNTYDIHTSCSENILGDVYGPFTVIGYTDGDGNSCDGGSVSNTPMPQPSGSACDCNGRMYNFTIAYSGANGGAFTATTGSQSSSATSIMNVTGIQNGDEIIVSGNWSGGRLGPKTFITVGGVTYEVHTSCSEDIMGNTYGPFTVISYTDGNGVTCNAYDYYGCNGSASVVVSGGTAPYTVHWSNGDAGTSADSLCNEEYIVTITDANGCTRIDTINVGEPDPIVFNETVTDISCHGCASQTSCDINFSDLDNGEEVNTQYALSGVTISAISNNTSSGYNKVIVFDTDLSGTQDPDLEINVGNVLIFPENVNDGNNDGLIDNPDDDVYGGTVTLTFSSARDVVSFDFYDKDGGQSGWAKAYDANNNVIASASIPNMGNASIQTITLNAQGATKLVIYYYDSGAFGNFKFNCGNGGTCDGEVDLAPSGGTAPYTYVWSNGETTEDIDGLTPGTYSVVITDANGCTENGSFVIEEPTPLAVSLSATDVDCFGASTGVIDATVSGATPGYTFDWSGPGGFTSSLEDITSLVAGDYELTVTDSRGCSETATVTITEPQGMTVTSTVNDASCTDASDGDVDIAVTGGSVSTTTGTVWQETFEDNSNGATSDNGSTAWTRSSNACYTAEVQTVGNDKVFGAANGDSKWYSEVIDISNSGSVDVSVNLGSSQGGYHESSGSYVDYVKVFHRIDGGSWCLFTTNGANYGEISSSGVNAIHNNISGSTLEIKVWMHSTSNNEEYYVDDVTVTGSISSTYTYAWSNGATTQDISGLSVGTYTVTITDDAGCAQVETFTVGSPAAIVVGGTALDVSCSGSQTTETTVYDYNGSRSFWMPGLAHGNEPNWTLANGKLTQYPDGSAHLTGSLTNNLYASKQFDCSIWFTNKSDWTSWSGQGKTWKGSAGTVGNNYQDWTYYDFDDTKNNVLTGKSYYAGFTLNLTQRPSNKTMGLQIGDAANDKDSDFGLSTWFYYNGTFQGTGYSGDGDINSDASTSSAGCDGEVDMTFTGGTSPYSYSWSTGATSEDIDELCSGSYTVTVTDGNGCTGTKTYTVSDPSPIVASASASQSPCGGGTINLSVSGGSSPYTYTWTGPNGYTASSEDVTVTNAGTYEVTVTDANGCRETATATINQSANLTVSVSTSDVDCYGNTNGSATAQVSGGSTPYTYSWSNGGSAATAGQLSAGSYYVTVTDGNGCSIVKAVSITEPSELQLNLSANVHGNGYNVSTNGGSDGSISASVTGGTTPYSYTWNGGGTIKTVSKRISREKDDAEEYSNGQMSRYSSDLELVNDGSAGNQKVGVRFRNLGIPQGATIVDAYIQFSTEGTSRNTSTASLTIKGEKSGNCNYFSSSSYDISNRTLTNASVAWSPSQWHTLCEAGANQQTPDLKNVVQEIVNLNNWDVNDAMVFVITGSGRREAFSYDGNSSKAAKLYVRYTEAPAGANPSNLTAGNYSVVVTDANGCSKTANITLDEPPLSTPFADSRNDEEVDQRGVVSNVKIGPNPVANEGVVSVELSETEQVEVVVMDMTGKDLLDVFNGTLEAGTTNTLRADMTALRAGIYQICVRTSSGEVDVQRFVIAR